jgi:hypothetical protein
MAKNSKPEISKAPRLVRNSKSDATGTPPPTRVEAPRPPQPASDPDSFERLNELIRMRAYELYEKRGRGEGLGLEAQDWLQAEQEVMEQYRKRTA